MDKVVNQLGCMVEVMEQIFMFIILSTGQLIMQIVQTIQIVQEV